MLTGRLLAHFLGLLLRARVSCRYCFGVTPDVLAEVMRERALIAEP